MFFQRQSWNGGERPLNLGNIHCAGWTPGCSCRIHAYEIPLGWGQCTVLQCIENGLILKIQPRLEIVRLCAVCVDSCSLELLDDQDCHLPTQSGFRGRINSMQNSSSECKSLLNWELSAVHVGARLLILCVELLGIHEHDVLETIANPIISHCFVRVGGDHALVLLTPAIPHQPM